MPRNPVAARRYAHAFFQLTDKPTEALTELKVLVSVFKKNPDAEKFFLSPAVSMEDKVGALSDLKAKLPVSYIFLETLVEAGRLECLDGIVEEFEKFCEEKTGELSVEVESATKLSEGVLEDIRVLLQDKWKKKLKLHTKTNPELIGGFIARAPGKLLDASVVSQLESLQEQLFN
ncbi:MAG: synthase delta subunit [Bacteriovoracaceae bacterium]|nr:synthase delta subunit [Bacteriovoracaceae bacterium]